MYGKIKEHLQQELAEIKAAGLYKSERVITSPQRAEIEVAGRKVLNFCANNYLGLSDNPRLIEAAKKACCHEFISALPEGYHTLVGEGGATLSGGERQRISIARAILKDAPIIILDEATASVDPENERELQAAIAELTKDKTILMIAHRLSTVRNADQILVLDKGRIVQRGTHRELMEEQGLYRRFIQMREAAIGWNLRRKEELSANDGNL